MTRAQIIKRVKEAGVIGKGGAGFPTHAKLSAKADIFLSNGAECEPLLSNDKVLMERYPREIVRGMRLAMRCVGAKQGYMCVKSKYKSAIKALDGALKGDSGIKIFPLDDFYPAGDEVIMVKEALGRRVPGGGIPIDAGVVVNNVGSLKKICKAVDSNENVTRKYVSVNGEVRDPKVVNVPIGMRVSETLALCGGVGITDYAIISGGPNMGALASRDDVIKKTTGALIVLPKSHPLIASLEMNINTITSRAKAACINCRFCTDMCPRRLVGHNIYPHKIMRAISLGLDSQVEALTGALLCSGCGVCENFACNMLLSPRKVCQKVKAELIRRGVKNPHSDVGWMADNLFRERRIPGNRLKARLSLTGYSDDLKLDERFHDADEVKIMLNQHIGAVSAAVVREGDYVRAGDTIAVIPDGKLGAAYHASISGRVAKCANDHIIVRHERKGK